MSAPARRRKSRIPWRRAWQAAVLCHLGRGLKDAVFWAAVEEMGCGGGMAQAPAG